MRHTPRVIGVLTAAFLAALVIRCAQPETPPPAKSADSKQALPVVSLDETAAFPLKSHVESADIASGALTFASVFEAGDSLFHTPFNGLDGVGILVRADGTQVPRFAPLGPRGPSAQMCGECHNFPVGSSAGLAHSSAVRDFSGKGAPPFDVRSVTSLFGDGILQLLAQEMTEELQATRDAVEQAAKSTPGKPASRALTSKGTSFGSIAATAAPDGKVTIDVSQVVGLDPDLVVRPMGWKGDAAIIRTVTMGVSMGGLGMQPEEIIGKIPGGDKMRDLDGDGVKRELSVGDITAMTIYTAAQETPTDVVRLATLGYVQAPSAADVARLETGRAQFAAMGCAACHTPDMPLKNTRFEEPTLRGNGNYYDQALAKLDPNYDPKRPAAFDILQDAQAPRAEAGPSGGAVIRLYGDLKRHAMGRLLADRSGPSDPATADGSPLKYNGQPVKIAADQFLTAELWGVGNTGPWLHDNRAGSLREAILLHGEDAPVAAGQPGRSEAQESRDRFKAAADADQRAVIAFLLNLRTFSPARR